MSMLFKAQYTAYVTLRGHKKKKKKKPGKPSVSIAKVHGSFSPTFVFVPFPLKKFCVRLGPYLYEREDWEQYQDHTLHGRRVYA